MEIQPSIVSQAVYGENGRVAVPLNIFMKKSNNKQIGGKKDIEELGVPLVVALVNINVNKPCNHIDENMYHQMPNEYFSEKQIPEGEQSSPEFEPISDEVYDTLLNTVLAEKMQESDNNEDAPVKKYTRKIRK